MRRCEGAERRRGASEPRPPSRAVLAAVLLAGAATLPAGRAQPSPPGGPRLTVIISDLHMGPGRDAATGAWLPLEDFRWGAEFAAFLRAVDQAGGGTVDLILNGDSFELWQSAAGDCRSAAPDVGCTEAEALGRLEGVLAAHAPELAELGAFARRGTNRVVIVPGDHDAALLVPALADRVRAALAAPGRVEVAARGYWLSPDGAIFAEHGHQRRGDPYSLSGWPQPFVGASGERQLVRPWGEALVQQLYNRHESRYPVLDNFAQDGAGLKYLAVADVSAVPAQQIGPLVRFFVGQPTWQQFRLELDGGHVQPPEWDLEAVRRAGPAFLVESLFPDDRFRPLADRALAAGQIALAGWDDAELHAVCDYRAALRRARRRLERSLTQVPHVGRPVAECARLPETRGSAFEYFWRSRDDAMREHVARVRDRIARDGRPSQALAVLAMGHTHLPATGLAPGGSTSAPIVINGGAWQRTLTPFQADEVIRERGWSEAELLQRLQPEQLPACYGVVWIAPYADMPEPRLRFWRADGSWGTLPRDAGGMAAACGGRGPQA